VGAFEDCIGLRVGCGRNYCFDSIGLKEFLKLNSCEFGSFVVKRDKQALVKIYFTANILQYLILHNTAGGSEYCNNIVESDVNCSSTFLFIHNCNGTAST
jgi:hypothetical protein